MPSHSSKHNGFPSDHNPTWIDRLSPLNPVQTAPVVDIIVPVYNKIEMTLQFLKSLKDHTKHPYRLIIVDNGSDDLPDSLIDGFSDALIVRCQENLGFAGGCNKGIAASRNTIAAVVNNDVILTEGWLQRMVKGLLRDPTIAAIAPCTNYSAGFQQVEDANYTSEAKMRIFAKEFASKHPGLIEDVEFVTGMCLVMRRNVLEQTRGFDERFKIGNFEDNDLCLRIKMLGLRIVVARDVFIHHLGNRTFQELRVDYETHMRNNQALYHEKWKNDSFFNACKLHEAKVWQEALKAYLQSLKERESNHDALFRIGVLLNDLKKHEAAAKSFRRYLKVCPDSTKAAIGLGQSLCLQGDVEKGMAQINSVLKSRYLKGYEKKELDDFIDALTRLTAKDEPVQVR